MTQPLQQTPAPTPAHQIAVTPPAASATPTPVPAIETIQPTTTKSPSVSQQNINNTHTEQTAKNNTKLKFFNF